MGGPKGRMVALQTYLQSLTMRGLCSGNGKKGLNKGIPKHESAIHESMATRKGDDWEIRA